MISVLSRGETLFIIYKNLNCSICFSATCVGCDSPAGYYETNVGGTAVCSATDVCICSEGLYGSACDTYRCKY